MNLKILGSKAHLFYTDDETLSSLIEAAESKTINEVVVHGGGGSVHVSYEIALLLEAYNLKVSIRSAVSAGVLYACMLRANLSGCVLVASHGVGADSLTAIESMHLTQLDLIVMKRMAYLLDKGRLAIYESAVRRHLDANKVIRPQLMWFDLTVEFLDNFSKTQKPKQ